MLERCGVIRGRSAYPWVHNKPGTRHAPWEVLHAAQHWASAGRDALCWIWLLAPVRSRKHTGRMSPCCHFMVTLTVSCPSLSACSQTKGRVNINERSIIFKWNCELTLESRSCRLSSVISTLLQQKIYLSCTRHVLKNTFLLAMASTYTPTLESSWGFDISNKDAPSPLCCSPSTWMILIPLQTGWKGALTDTPKFSGDPHAVRRWPLPHVQRP